MLMQGLIEPIQIHQYHYQIHMKQPLHPNLMMIMITQHSHLLGHCHTHYNDRCMPHHHYLLHYLDHPKHHYSPEYSHLQYQNHIHYTHLASFLNTSFHYSQQNKHLKTNKLKSYLRHSHHSEIRFHQLELDLMELGKQMLESQHLKQDQQQHLLNPLLVQMKHLKHQ